MNYHMFEVGGAVRDALAGRPIHDRDWCIVGLNHQQALQLGFTPISLRSVPGLRLYLHPQSRDECTLLEGDSIEANLRQRDFTINAMARAPDGTLIDPYGGCQDFQQGYLRHVDEATFSRDPIRVLRGARFCACWPRLRLATETVRLFDQLTAEGQLDRLYPERIWQELIKALAGEAPQRFFGVLKSCGALQVCLPELAALFGTDSPLQGLDAGDYSLQVLKRLARRESAPLTRFGALIFQLGHRKPQQGWQLVDRLRGSKEYLRLAWLIESWYPVASRPYDYPAGTLLRLLEVSRAFHDPGMLEIMIKVAETDYEIRQSPSRAGSLRDLLKITGQVVPLPSWGTGKQLASRLRLERQRVIRHFLTTT